VLAAQLELPELAELVTVVAVAMQVLAAMLAAVGLRRVILVVDL
jgi:hypothetical protein